MNKRVQDPDVLGAGLWVQGVEVWRVGGLHSIPVEMPPCHVEMAGLGLLRECRVLEH